MSMAELKDIQVSQPPSDTISDLAFSPTADFLAASSWDNQVRIWEISGTGQSAGKAAYSHEGPALAVCWSKDGTKIVSGGADKAVRLFDVATGQTNQVGQHDQPVRCVKYAEVNGTGVVATGSWDKTLKYWDLRSPNPAATVTLPERCYAMDVASNLLVVGTADRHILCINLNNPTTIHKQLQSPLKWQTRCISCFPSATGYAIGSVEGRVAIQYVEEKDSASNFSFRCHRDSPPSQRESLVYAVNSIVFHQQYGTFATSGADGSIHFWDKDLKQRLQGFYSINTPITATAWSRTGSIFAYGASYDWSKGFSGSQANQTHRIFLHEGKDAEIKPRARNAAKR